MMRASVQNQELLKMLLHRNNAILNGLIYIFYDVRLYDAVNSLRMPLLSRKSTIDYLQQVNDIQGIVLLNQIANIRNGNKCIPINPMSQCQVITKNGCGLSNRTCSETIFKHLTLCSTIPLHHYTYVDINFKYLNNYFIISLNIVSHFKKNIIYLVWYIPCWVLIIFNGDREVMSSTPTTYLVIGVAYQFTSF